MKKIRIAGLLLVGAMTFCCTACQKEDVKPTYTETIGVAELPKETSVKEYVYDNLDVTGAEVIVPEMVEGNVASVQFSILEKDFAVLEEKLIETIKKYFGLEEVDRSDFLYDCRMQIGDTWVQSYIPMDEATQEEKATSHWLLYNDAKKNSAILALGTFFLELCRGDFVLSVAPDSINSDKYGVRPLGQGTQVKTYRLPEDDITGISYALSDGEVLLSDAIAKVEAEIEQNYAFVGSPYLEYRVYEVDVRKLETCYFYKFSIAATYKGIDLNHTSAIWREGEDTAGWMSLL